MLSFYKQHKPGYSKTLNVSEESNELIIQLAKQLSKDIGIISDFSTFKLAIEKEVLKVCDMSLQKEQLNQMRQELDEGKMDHVIFSDKPQITPELKYFIDNRNRDFSQTLLMKTTSLHTLQYWFEQGKVKLPKDALVLAIHLRSHKIVFEYLRDKSDCFLGISVQDQKDLLERAEIKLKEYRKESYEFLLDYFSKPVSSKPNP